MLWDWEEGKRYTFIIWCLWKTQFVCTRYTFFLYILHNHHLYIHFHTLFSTIFKPFQTQTLSFIVGPTSIQRLTISKPFNNNVDKNTRKVKRKINKKIILSRKHHNFYPTSSFKTFLSTTPPPFSLLMKISLNWCLYHFLPLNSEENFMKYGWIIDFVCPNIQSDTN